MMLSSAADARGGSPAREPAPLRRQRSSPSSGRVSCRTSWRLSATRSSGSRSCTFPGTNRRNGACGCPLPRAPGPSDLRHRPRDVLMRLPVMRLVPGPVRQWIAQPAPGTHPPCPRQLAVPLVHLRAERPEGASAEPVSRILAPTRLEEIAEVVDFGERYRIEAEEAGRIPPERRDNVMRHFRAGDANRNPDVLGVGPRHSCTRPLHKNSVQRPG